MSVRFYRLPENSSCRGTSYRMQALYAKKLHCSAYTTTPAAYIQVFNSSSLLCEEVSTVKCNWSFLEASLQVSQYCVLQLTL
jgi:hypothetical protein